MIKLKFGKPQIICAEKKGAKITVALIDCTIYDPADKKHPIAEFKVSGKTRCHKEDTYDKRTGTIIALNKAKQAAYGRAMEEFFECSLESYRNSALEVISKIAFYDNMKYYKRREKENLKDICTNGIPPKK